MASRTLTPVIFLNAASEEFYGFFDLPQPGTSGKPVMIPYSSSGLALVTTFTSAFSGPIYHSLNWSSIISTLDALAGVSTGYLPNVVSLSAFTNFG